MSNLIVLRSTGMKGMPANRMTTIATHTRFSMRIEDSTPVAFVGALGPRAQPFLNHDDHERQREHAAGHEDVPDAVADDPPDQGQVILR